DEGQGHEIGARGLPRNEAESGRQELERSGRTGRRHQADALPWILLLVTHRDAHMSRGREVDGGIAGTVHHRRDRERARGVYAERTPQALVAVAQRSLNQADRGHQAAALVRSRNRARKPVSTPPAAKSGSASIACWKASLVA